MKIFIQFFVFMFIITPLLYADLYVTYTKSDGKVVDISKQNDAIKQPGQEKVVVQDQEIVQEAQFYDIKNGKLVFNAKRYNEYQGISYFSNIS